MATASMHTPSGTKSFDFVRTTLTLNWQMVWLHKLSDSTGCLLAVGTATDLSIVGGCSPEGVPFEGTWPNQKYVSVGHPIANVFHTLRKDGTI